MKISMYKFYKTSIITCLVLGVIWIIVPFAPYLFYYDGSIEDLIFLLCITLPIGFGIALFPIMLYHRQLTHVSLERDKCTSYSLLNRKLCEVAFNESVFYTFFDVKFLYAPPIRFIALSNMPFKCEQNAKSIAERGFYGNYDRSKIVILPYDEQVSPFLNLSTTAAQFQNGLNHVSPGRMLTIVGKENIIITIEERGVTMKNRLKVHPFLAEKLRTYCL